MQIGSKGNTWEETVCPYCDCDCIHPINVRVYPVKGKTEYEINSKGVSARNSDAAKSQRGVSIVIRFQCEYGHIWDTEFLFNKGDTSVHNTLIRELGGDEMLEGSKVPDVIWRR